MPDHGGGIKTCMNGKRMDGWVGEWMDGMNSEKPKLKLPRLCTLHGKFLHLEKQPCAAL